jgi:hypothetical protein
MNDPILALPSSHVTPQIDAVPVTLNRIEWLTPTREWRFPETFETNCRKLSAVLQKKTDHPRVVEVRPPRRVIYTQATNRQQSLTKALAAIQVSPSLSVRLFFTERVRGSERLFHSNHSYEKSKKHRLRSATNN